MFDMTAEINNQIARLGFAYGMDERFITINYRGGDLYTMEGEFPVLVSGTRVLYDLIGTPDGATYARTWEIITDAIV